MVSLPSALKATRRAQAARAALAGGAALQEQFLLGEVAQFHSTPSFFQYSSRPRLLTRWCSFSRRLGQLLSGASLPSRAASVFSAMSVVGHVAAPQAGDQVVDGGVAVSVDGRLHLGEQGPLHPEGDVAVQ